MPVLVKWNKDWADEFDMTGFVVMDDDEYERYMDSLSTLNYPVECGFGTNEYYEFESKDDVLDGLSSAHITINEVSSLKKLFGINYKGGCSFGWFPSF